jgi:hypothetical protein
MKIHISLSKDLELPLFNKDTYDVACDIWEYFPHNLWQSNLKSEIIGIISNSITRGKESIKQDHETIRASGLDIELTLQYLDDNKVVLRGDYRYPSTKIAAFLKANPTKNTPPIQIGKTNAGLHLLDGHHRWRAYKEVNRKPLVLIVDTIPRIGKEPCIKLNIRGIT